MVDRMRWMALMFGICVAASCGGEGEAPSEDPRPATIDQRSYRLGSIGAFSEMVDAGVKKLALSAAVEPGEMDALVGDALQIAAGHNVEIYRESDFLVTDLFPEELTAGKDVLLIYRGDTRREYMELKAEQEGLVAAGQYDETARQDIARRFGKLLSYSDEKIDDLLR